MRAALALLLLAACGGSGDDDGASPDATALADGGVDATVVTGDGILVDGQFFALTGSGFFDSAQGAFTVAASTDPGGACPAPSPDCVDVLFSWSGTVTSGTVHCGDNAALRVSRDGQSLDGSLAAGGSCDFDVSAGDVGQPMTVTHLTGTLSDGAGAQVGVSLTTLTVTRGPDQ